MNKSFTLIEILVVIVVIGILSSFILVGMSSITDKANIAKGQAFSNSLRNSLLTNLVSEWKFDGIGVADGQSADETYIKDSWGSNNGTIINHQPDVNSGSSCVSGSCLSFAGANTDYVAIGDIGTFDFDTSNFTLSVWAKPFLLNADNRLITKWNNGSNGWALNVYNADGYLDFVTNNGTVFTRTRSASLIKTSNWYYFVAIKNGTDGKMFIDGVEPVYAMKDSMVNPTVNNYGLFIGAEYSATWYFTGLIDEVRIYNQATSSSQIKQNYYLGLNSLYKNQGITQLEYVQKLSKLRNSAVQN